MTLYEELGISPDASADEIRRAYRTLADPVRRQEYDAAAALAVLPCPKGGRLSGRDAAWFLAGLAVATLYWRLTPAAAPTPKSNGEPVAQARSVPSPGTCAAASKRPAGASAVPAPARPEPGEVRMGFTRPPEPSFPSEPAALSPAALAAAPAVPAVRQPAPAEPAAAPPPAASRFSGTWIYVPPRVAASEKALYPPEYIETVILEDSGEIRGRRRARYRVPDRPISSEVAFRFAGRAVGDAADLTWNGAGGSEGGEWIGWPPRWELNWAWLPGRPFSPAGRRHRELRFRQPTFCSPGGGGHGRPGQDRSPTPPARVA